MTTWMNPQPPIADVTGSWRICVEISVDPHLIVLRVPEGGRMRSHTIPLEAAVELAEQIDFAVMGARSRQ